MQENDDIHENTLSQKRLDGLARAREAKRLKRLDPNYVKPEKVKSAQTEKDSNMNFYEQVILLIMENLEIKTFNEGQMKSVVTNAKAIVDYVEKSK